MRIERCVLAWLREEALGELPLSDGEQTGRSWKSRRCFAEDIRSFQRYERRSGSRVFKEVANQVGRRLRVHHDQDGSSPQNPEEGGDEISAVRQRYDHALFWTNVSGGEKMPILRRELRDVAVRP